MSQTGSHESVLGQWHKAKGRQGLAGVPLRASGAQLRRIGGDHFWDRHLIIIFSSLQLHDLKPWLVCLIVLNCQDVLCKFIAKFDKMKQMWLNYYETNRNYEEKNVIHVQCSYCPTCSVPKWRNANGWTWGSLWLKMSYSSSFGWLFGLFLFRYWTWRGGGKKNPAKKTCTKKWKIL